LYHFSLSVKANNGCITGAAQLTRYTNWHWHWNTESGVQRPHQHITGHYRNESFHSVTGTNNHNSTIKRQDTCKHRI